MMWKYTVTVLVLEVLLFSTPASAQGDDRSLAKQAFSQGQELFTSGDYAGARDHFEESLVVFPHFRTIFNIALCEEKLGHTAEAIKIYSRYLDWPAEIPERESIARKVETLKKKLLPPEEPKVEKPKERRPVLKTLDSDSVFETEQGRGANLVVPGWITAGAGVAGVIASGVLIGLSRSKLSEMRSVEQNTEVYNPDKHGKLPKEGKSLDLAGWITGGIGLASLGTGVVLLVLSDSKKGERVSVSLSFSTLNSGAKAGVLWGF